jgi:16S rRNA processing protein RimM
VLKLADVDSISAAELLAGRELLIPSANLPPLEPDTWFVRDLIGCQLFDNRTFVGEISGVEYSMSPDGRTRLPDTAPLLEVTLASDLRGTHATSPNDTSSHRAPALIPFIKTWLDSVDLDEKRVVMHLPPGLLDLNDEPH